MMIKSLILQGKKVVWFAISSLFESIDVCDLDFKPKTAAMTKKYEKKNWKIRQIIVDVLCAQRPIWILYFCFVIFISLFWADIQCETFGLWQTW